MIWDCKLESSLGLFPLFILFSIGYCQEYTVVLQLFHENMQFKWRVYVMAMGLYGWMP